MPELYPYAAARVHAREPLLLGRQQLEQLLAAKTYEDCLKTLRGFGWDGGDTAEEILAAETEKTWKLMEELLPDPELFRMFRLPVDFNNAKAAIKSAVTQVQPEGVFLPGGSLDPEALLEAAKTGEFSKLPDWMAQPMEKARKLLLQTRGLPSAGRIRRAVCGGGGHQNRFAGGENKPAFLLFAGGFGFLPQRGEESPDRSRPGRNGGSLPVSGPDPLWRWGRGPGGGGFRF